LSAASAGRRHGGRKEHGAHADNARPRPASSKSIWIPLPV
jgi:hypothetical protein